MPNDPVEGQGYTEIAYNDSTATGTVIGPTITTTKLLNKNGNVKSVTQQFDGLWHVVETEATDPDNASGGLVKVSMTYDGEGHELSVSNPYWTTSPSVWTTFSYDALGRKVYQQQQDGSLLQWCYDDFASDGQTNCHSHFGTGATDSFVDASDESGNDWQRTTDGLGRLVEVAEPNGSTTAPSMETDYTYDPMNNLLSVNQTGGSGTARTRSFTYDALSRLTQSYNVEPGWICYGTTGGVAATGTNCTSGYDGNGNLKAKTDARGITVSYSYDALNREFSKSYSQGASSTGEPSACTQYDKPLSAVSDSFPIGRVTAEWMAPAGTCPAVNSPISSIPSTSFSNTSILSHDIAGRVTSESQCPFGSACGSSYTFNYSFDLAGGTTSFNNGLTPTMSTPTNPALTWGVTFDNAERIANVQVTQQPTWTDSYHKVAYIEQSDPVNTLAALGAPAYDPWGHLVNEQASLATSPTSPSGMVVLSSYDTRARITSEVAGGQQTVAVATGSFGVIAVNGMEQSTQPPATAKLTISGAPEGPVTYYPCGNSECPEPVYDSGTITVTVKGNAVTENWGGNVTSAQLANGLAETIMGDTSTLGVTAFASGSTVWLVANSNATLGSSISFSASAVDTSPAGVFSSPAFSVAASGSTFYGGGGATVYDSGNLTVSLTNPSTGAVLATTPAVAWSSSSTSATLAPLLVTALNTNSGSNITGSLITAAADETGVSINLQSKGTGNSDNYGIVVNIADTTSTNNPSYYPSSLPTPGFQFDSSSTAGASSGAPETNYGMIYSYYVPAGGYAANGNITAHSDTVMGDWAFQYDTLNRLTLAAPAENAPSSYIHAVACFGYDGFGNRSKAAFDTSSSDCSATAGTTTASYTATNQVSFVSQSSPISYSAPTGFIYDGAGNVYQDGKNTYAYDGEGRLCAVTLTAGGTQYQYLYDAEGLRVGQATFTGAFPAKNAVCAAPGAATGFALTKQYLLDQGGDQVTELTGTGVWKHSNVWAGSHLQATYDTVGLHYYLADPLGTKRVQANITGQTEETCQSLPFGDNLSCSQTALATADDATEHHFTGKERDSESGNDYFGARYYSSPVGRFLSPDWSAKEEPVPYAKLDDPQTLNLYGYVGNNPLSRVDANGHGYLLEKFEEIFYAKVSVGPGVGAELKLTKYLGVKAEARAGFEVKKTAKEETGSLKAEATLKVKAGPFEAGKKASAEMQVEKDGKLDVKKPTVQCCELSAGSGPLEASKNEIGVGGHYGAFGGEVGADVDKAKEFLAAVKDRVANASQEFMKKLLK